MVQKFQNSLVIVAESHNPTLFSETFLIKTGIIENPKLIKRESTIFTPPFVRITLSDNSTISLDQQRLIITSTGINHDPFLRGIKYCQNLKYIIGIALGINFDVIIGKYDFDKWFQKLDFDKETKCREVKFKYSNCNIAITYINNESAKIQFNYHYDLGKKSLGEMEIDINKEWDIKKEEVQNFLLKLLPEG